MALEIKRTPKLKGKEAEKFLEKVDRDALKKIPKSEVLKDLKSICATFKNGKINAAL